MDRVDPTNRKALDWWQNKWADTFEPLSDINKAVYGEILSSETNYLPITWREVTAKAEEWSLDKILAQSSFKQTVGSMAKETTVLKAKRKFDKTPEGKYVDLNFDKNMMKAMDGAQIDIHTAAKLKQLTGAVNSASFKALFPNEETASSIKDKVITQYVADLKGRINIGSGDFKEVNKWATVIGRAGARLALGSLAQPIKQTVPVAINTFANAGFLELGAIWRQDEIAFIRRAGRGIVTRGEESLINVDSIERLSEADWANPNRVANAVSNAGKMWMSKFLVASDVAIARASWMTYYKKSLMEQGISTNQDWSKTNVNKVAADYAQFMVDRQQNISDQDLAGLFMKSKKPGAAIVRKILFPFAGFQMNQKTRMYTDIAVMLDAGKKGDFDLAKTHARSLTGLMAEQFAFNSISHYIRLGMFSIAASLIGYQEPDEDRKAREKRSKAYASSNMFMDLLSPVPITDSMVAYQLMKALNYVGKENLPDILDISPRINNDPWGDLGTVGVMGGTLDKALGSADMLIGETFTSSYQGQETKRVLAPYDKDYVYVLSGFDLAYMLGLLPRDFSDLSKNMKTILKKRSSTLKEVHQATERYERKVGGWEGGFFEERRPQTIYEGGNKIKLGEKKEGEQIERGR